MAKINKISIVSYIMIAFLGVFLAAYQRIATEISLEFTGGMTLIGTLSALLYFGIFVSSTIMGELSMRIGKKKVTIIGVFLMMSGQILLFLSTSVPFVIAGSIFIGIGYGVCESQFSSILVDADPGNTTKVINLSQMIFVIGAILSPVLVHMYLNNNGNWRFVFLYIGIMFIIMLFLLIPQKYGTKPSRVSDKIFVFSLFKDRLFTLLIICMALYVGIEAGAGFYMIDFFKYSGLYENQGTLALSLFWLLMVPGRFVAGLLKKAELRVLKLSIIISGIAIVGALIIPAAWAKILCFSLLGLGAGPIWPAITSLTGICFSKCTGAAFGIIMASCAIGGILFPLLMGLIANTAGLIFGYMALLLIIVAMLFIQSRITSLIKQRDL